MSQAIELVANLVFRRKDEVRACASMKGAATSKRNVDDWTELLALLLADPIDYAKVRKLMEYPDFANNRNGADYGFVSAGIEGVVLADPAHAGDWLDFLRGEVFMLGRSFGPAFPLGAYLGLFRTAIWLDRHDPGNNFLEKLPEALAHWFVEQDSGEIKLDEEPWGREYRKELSKKMRSYERGRNGLSDEKRWGEVDEIFKHLVTYLDGEEQNTESFDSYVARELIKIVFSELPTGFQAKLLLAADDLLVPEEGAVEG